VQGAGIRGTLRTCSCRLLLLLILVPDSGDCG
jgi:hypothetical protein